MRRMARLIARLLWASRRLLPLLIWIAIQILLLEITSALALAVGVRTTTGRIADEWWGRVIKATGTSRFDAQIRSLLEGIAFLMLVVGWVIMAAATLAVIELFLLFVR